MTLYQSTSETQGRHSPDEISKNGETHQIKFTTTLSTDVKRIAFGIVGSRIQKRLRYFSKAQAFHLPLKLVEWWEKRAPALKCNSFCLF